MEINIQSAADELLGLDIEPYWYGFQKVAYAIYNSSEVFLFHHPKFQNQTFHKLGWDRTFAGNTVIMYEHYPTAIVNIEGIKDMASIKSFLVHELFHGFQYLREEKRFPDELLGVTYPLLKENVELRSRERQCLFDALEARDLQERESHLYKFIQLRGMRKELLGPFFTYETKVETIEGPAYYVELKAHAEESPLSWGSLLDQYGRELIHSEAASLHLRRSCYYSGLWICLLLDELLEGWQQDFLQSEDCLYDFLKSHVTLVEQARIKDINVSEETETTVEYVKANRIAAFKSFEESAGFHVIIEGIIAVKSIDPQNIDALPGRLLHHNYVKVSLGIDEFLIQQPVVSYYETDLWKASKLHVVVEKRPVLSGERVTLDGIGEMRGVHIFKENGNIFQLYV
ncbi:hypothetical protein ACFQ3J_01400 [Paenibacillus provencensis]|uniref:Peptide ABC transporter permease n=1 Tax=Paenibacillus provencensis TaxID=441151 RepID=A0ABW3PPG6_9BACL|nr:hypothetical protein [Paenibacillus sp. MER 78]MCM3126305.1 hypothetical protein [Paenibacillus sp. MER 78]